MEAAHYQLLLGDVEGTRKAMDQSQKQLDSMIAMETAAHASFYRVCADYYKVSLG